MRLVRLAKQNWEVLAVCDARGRCQVLDFLAELDGSYHAAVSAMLFLLRRAIPMDGPPRAEPLCKPLGDGLFELRREPKGKKLRVIWFYGGGTVIVCSSAFTKAERTPRMRIEQAKFFQKQYTAARARGDVQVVDLEKGWSWTS